MREAVSCARAEFDEEERRFSLEMALDVYENSNAEFIADPEVRTFFEEKFRRLNVRFPG